MMTKRITSLLALFGLASLTLAAEESVFDHPVNDQSRDAMTSACSRIAANPVVSGHFIQTKRVTRLKKDFVSTGTFIFSGQLGVYWQVIKPFASTTIMTADKLVQKTADGRTSVMDGGSNTVFKRFADTIQAVFAGRLTTMETDFSLYFLPQDNGWRLGLIPKEASVRKVIASMEIRGERFIESFQLLEASGDQISYQFKDCQLVPEHSADEKRQFLF